jgi:hypothetical protein
MGKKMDELPINLQPPQGEPSPPGVGPLPSFGGGGGSLSFQKYGKISGPPAARGSNPLEMVQKLLKDPLNLAFGGE